MEKALQNIYKPWFSFAFSVFILESDFLALALTATIERKFLGGQLKRYARFY